MIFPVPRFVDGRLPVISDGFDSVRTTTAGLQFPHGGVDIMYASAPGDPAFGTSPATRSRAHVMPDGVPFLAAFDGTVVTAQMTVFGGSVVVAHGENLESATFYAHGSQIFVRPGQHVVAGQPLGIIGGDPRFAPNLKHLHFELWPQGFLLSHVDPAPDLATATLVPFPASSAPVARAGAGGGGLALALGVVLVAGLAGGVYYVAR